jgi:hypothetical protein
MTSSSSSSQSNAVRIILEQMRQRNMSNSNESPLLYVHIGSRDVDILMTDEWCQPDCQEIGYVKKGGEVDTIQKLWEYCSQDHAHQYDIVTYIHNKGAFHNTQFNEKIRRRATKAALDCREQLLSTTSTPTLKRTTNACAGRVSLLPQYLANGNMWSAKCDYIKNLMEPRQYASTLRRMYTEGLGLVLPRDDDDIDDAENGQKNKKTMNSTQSYDRNKAKCLENLRPMNIKPNHLGLGRFAYERWVWSHPDVVPADVFPSDKIMDKYTNGVNLPNWKPTSSFRRSFGHNPKTMGLDTSFGKSNWARLQGRLFEWNYIYGKAPHNNSWIWKFYKGYETAAGSVDNNGLSCYDY